ncbi:MAG: toll/interleukin-1 receptor domain-containing protein [Gemmataceae bacterium]|nr:toll/interleukin-1 receptor domain-containing protein [Gemmataceae bacterium]
MFWQILHFPQCEKHVFLSHSAIDRDWLVRPVFDRLKAHKAVPWVDQEDYYYGRNSRSALRDGLLSSRHVVFFVTLGMMNYKRGWCHLEAAYSEIIQCNLVAAGGNALNYDLPLFFIDQGDNAIERTIWSEMRDRGYFYRNSDGDPADWATHKIVEFLQREQALASQMAKVITPGDPVHAYLRAGLVTRVTNFHPSPL